MEKAAHTAVLVLSLLAVFKPDNCEETSTVCQTEACKDRAKSILENMNSAVDPCEDFYKFSCGKFIDTATISDAGMVNNTFSQVEALLVSKLKAILSEDVSDSEPLPYANVKVLHKLCMDEDGMDEQGTSPLLERIKAAGGWPVLGNWNSDKWSPTDTNIKLSEAGLQFESLFGFGILVDKKDSSKRSIYVGQATFALEREQLLEEKESDLLKAYKQYMIDVAVLLGADKRTAEEQMTKCLEFEIALAKITSADEDRRDINRMYNPYELQNMNREFSWLDWESFINSTVGKYVTIQSDEKIVVQEVEYLKNVGLLIKNYSSEVVANYMVWWAVYPVVDMFTREMRNRTLQFLSVYDGTSQRESRWSECTSEVVDRLPQAISSMYVKKYFDPESKKVATALVEDAQEAMRDTLLEVNWMDNTTRKVALKKLQNMIKLVGYPEELLDMKTLGDFYQELKIEKQHFFTATRIIERWYQGLQYRLLREPVKRDDWRTSPVMTEVNSYNDFLLNMIVIPAGILQGGFFNSQTPKYTIYGAIGMIIAHEVTHAFDDVGSQYDENGNLKEWRQKESQDQFKKKVQCVVNQYGNYTEPQTNTKVNGVITQGENVADNGGVKLAYRAYQTARQRLGADPSLPGLQQYSGDQLFFLSFANTWCSKYRTEFLKNSIAYNEHAPAEFRVKGSLVNLPEFSNAFQCQAGSKMNPIDKCSVW